MFSDLHASTSTIPQTIETLNVLINKVRSYEGGRNNGVLFLGERRLIILLFIITYERH